MMTDPIAEFTEAMDGRQFATILADPPWRFTNRTGKMAPEHRRLSRYGTMALKEICELPVADAAATESVAPRLAAVREQLSLLSDYL